MITGNTKRKRKLEPFIVRRRRMKMLPVIRLSFLLAATLLAGCFLVLLYHEAHFRKNIALLCITAVILIAMLGIGWLFYLLVRDTISRSSDCNDAV